MALRFSDSRKRIERARTHRDAFAACWNAAIDDNSYRAEIKADGGHGVVRAVRIKPLDIDLPLELGEFFYQLRSALDNAIFEAAILQIGAKVSDYEDRLYFPIFARPKGFYDSAFWQIPFPQELREWIEGIQPCNAAQSTVGVPQGWIQGLGILNDCCRKDRHRRLHVVAGVATEMAGVFNFPLTATMKSVSPLVSNLLEDNTEFLEFWYDGIASSEQFYVEGKLSVEISVDEIPTKGKHLISALTFFMDMTTQIIDKIGTFYPE